MTDIYINPEATSNGAGTEASPYNSFTEANALSGDLSGSTIYIKRGTSIRERLALTSCSNFVIDAYGVGAKPIIDGSDVFTGTWTYDADKNAWYIPYVEAGAYFVNGTQMVEMTYPSGNTKKYQVGEYIYYAANGLTYRCIQQSFGGGTPIPTNAAYWVADTNVPIGWMFFQSTTRIYIFTGGLDPNTQTIERNASARSSCILLTSCSDHRVSNMNCIRGWSSNIIETSAGNNIEISDNQLDYAGGWNSQGRDGVSLYGDYTGAKSTGCKILNNTGSYNQNNLIEIDATSGCLIQGNSGNHNGQLIELWGHNENCIIQRNYALNCQPQGSSNARGYGLWISGPVAGSGNQGANTGITIQSNLFVNGYNGGIELVAGGSNYIRNCTFALVGYYNSGTMIALTGTGTTVDVKNCLMSMPAAGQSAFSIAVGCTYTGDYNRVWRGIAFDLTNSWGGSYLGDSTLDKLSEWRTATSQDANSSIADPLFTDAANYDFTLQATSTCLNAGSAFWGAGGARLKAYNGELFGPVPSIGAIENATPFSPSLITQAPGG